MINEAWFIKRLTWLLALTQLGNRVGPREQKLWQIKI
jgi:hypothetical protein